MAQHPVKYSACSKVCFKILQLGKRFATAVLHVHCSLGPTCVAICAQVSFHSKRNSRRIVWLDPAYFGQAEPLQTFLSHSVPRSAKTRCVVLPSPLRHALTDHTAEAAALCILLMLSFRRFRLGTRRRKHGASCFSSMKPMTYKRERTSMYNAGAWTSYIYGQWSTFLVAHPRLFKLTLQLQSFCLEFPGSTPGMASCLNLSANFRTSSATSKFGRVSVPLLNHNMTKSVANYGPMLLGPLFSKPGGPH